MIDIIMRNWREATTRIEVCCMGCLLRPSPEELDHGGVGCPCCGHDRFATYDFRTVSRTLLVNSSTLEADAAPVFAEWASVDGRAHRRIGGNRWQLDGRKSAWIGVLGVSSTALLRAVAAGTWIWGAPERRIAMPVESIRRASTRRTISGSSYARA